MKKLAILTAGLAILLIGVAQVAMATPTLSGTIDTTADCDQTDGKYNYSYILSPTTLTPGTSPFALSGSVTGLAFGGYSNWLDIGLVTESVAVAATASPFNYVSMNNQSAYFIVGKMGWGDHINEIYVEAKDQNAATYNQVFLGNISTFNFTFTVTPNSGGIGGTFAVKINDDNNLVSSIAYGADNNQEFLLGNAYIIAQAYARINSDWGEPGARVQSTLTDVKVVPLPGTLVLLGSGLAGLGFYRQRRASGRQS
jgi:hypothetical protein